MKYHINRILLILGMIIPSILISACSDKEEVIHISTGSRAWLGVHVKDLSERRLNNLKLDYGLEVIKVYKDSPAAEAGLEVEDILLKINDRPLEKVSQLTDFIHETEVDEKINITYLRNGEQLETEATLSKRDRRVIVLDDKHRDLEYFVSDRKYAWFGVATSKLTDQLREFFNVPEYSGVLVKEVIEDSPAEKYGVKAGDVIIKFGRKEIEEPSDLIKAIKRYDPDEEVEVTVIRDKKEKVLKVVLEEGKGRFPRHFSFHPERFEVMVPEMEFEIPELHIKIPEFDVEKLEELRELEDKVREEMELHSEELEEQLEELEEELKEIKIHSLNRKSAVI
jgi:C-terminal processing protease CtpA/Prc